MRNRKVAKYGNTSVIRLRPKDIEDLGWEYGDLVDIDGCEKSKSKFPEHMEHRCNDKDCKICKEFRQ